MWRSISDRAAGTPVAVFMGVLCLGAQAAAFDMPVFEATVSPFISDRARVELIDWFDPGPAAAPQDNSDYAFFANVIRFGAEVRNPAWWALVEGQEVELVGLPDDAAGLGPGAAYFSNTREQDQRETHLRQAFLVIPNLLVEGLTLTGGRFVFNDGLERKAQDPTLDWVKRLRISQRLIGSFDYTHVGRSFDGGRLTFDKGPTTLTLMGGLPTAGGFNISANKHIDDLPVIYGALTVTEPDWLPQSDMRLFYVYYADGRDLVARDNRPSDVRDTDREDIDIHTVGANFATVHSAGPGHIDAMAWAAGQAGDWESLDHRAYAVAVESGYRLSEGPWKPWLRAGFFRSSGDGDPFDGDHETFFQLLPTARLYALTPFFNLMNNQDLFAQIILKPWDDLLVRLDYHYLRVTEEDDLLYAGGGATQQGPIFGYGGFPAGGDNGVAHLADLTLVYNATRHLQFWIYYGHAFGQSVIRNRFPADDDLNYAYLETTVKF